MGRMKGKISSAWSVNRMFNSGGLYTKGQKLTLKKAHSLFQRWKIRDRS
jgi:hypothetical protein